MWNLRFQSLNNRDVSENCKAAGREDQNLSALHRSLLLNLRSRPEMTGSYPCVVNHALNVCVRAVHGGQV